MECAGKGSRWPCFGPATRRCHRCRAVVYCSLSHQVSHGSVHRRECERLEKQMKLVDMLNDFPFTFTREAIQEEGRCSFLTGHGIHRLGMWMYECSCGVSAISFDNSRLIDYWDLLSELCPCKGPLSPMPQRITTWKDYYEWRCIPLNSPAALLIHWPLTVYQAIQLATRESLLPEISDELRIHYLGPEKELFQLAAFGELQALFPGIHVHIDFVGPAIPHLRNGEKVSLNTYAHCSEMNCRCKDPVDNHEERITTHHSSPITLRLHSGCYHDCYRELLKDSFPHIIIAPNAGIAAYMSWLPTLEVIKEIRVPAVFSDYCEEASLLAVSCISSVTATDPKIQIQMNPFRQPLCVEESALCIPCYSNCFLFGL